jgi:predicted transcriptional regulator
MVRTSITLPEELFKSLQHLAVDENKTLKELMTKAIEDYVRKATGRR